MVDRIIKRVDWSEVAAFLLTAERHKVAHNKGDDFHCEDQFNQLCSCRHEELMTALQDPNLATNRAASWLRQCEHDPMIWILHDLPIASLHMRGGNPGTKQHEVARELGRLPTIEEFANKIILLPENERACESIRTFFPLPNDPIPQFLRTVIARPETRQGTTVWQLGDGYHRCVKLFLLGEMRIQVYAPDSVST